MHLKPIRNCQKLSETVRSVKKRKKYSETFKNGQKLSLSHLLDIQVNFLAFRGASTKA